MQRTRTGDRANASQRASPRYLGRCDHRPRASPAPGGRTNPTGSIPVARPAFSQPEPHESRFKRAAPGRTPVSVIILAKDEERFIERCVRSASWADEVLVLDSGSTDRTREIAAASGAVVHEQEWLGWAPQRVRAIELASYDWVFYLDSDEIVTPRLADSVVAVAGGPMDPDDGYSVDRRGDFLGVLLPNDSRRSKRRSFVRLFNRTRSGYDAADIVHEEVRVPGRSIPLDGVLLHWRAYEMDEYVTVFNRYATVEAQMLDGQGVRSTGAKILYRPLLRFLWCYVYKRGFRLGARGLIWSLLKATSEYVRYAKLWERQNARATPHPPAELLDGGPSRPPPRSRSSPPA